MLNISGIVKVLKSDPTRNILNLFIAADVTLILFVLFTPSVPIILRSLLICVALGITTYLVLWAYHFHKLKNNIHLTLLNQESYFEVSSQFTSFSIFFTIDNQSPENLKIKRARLSIPNVPKVESFLRLKNETGIYEERYVIPRLATERGVIYLFTKDKFLSNQTTVTISLLDQFGKTHRTKGTVGRLQNMKKTGSTRINHV